MAGSQISTSVTIIDSLHGYQALSLTEYNTSAAAAIAAGSVVEIAGAFFTFSADEPIEASTWTSIVTATTAYITLTASGTAGSQIVVARYSATAPEWRDDFQGWYASVGSNIRVVGSVYKAEATSYLKKTVLPMQTYSNTTLGSNWDTSFKSALGLGWSTQFAKDYVWRGEIERITSGSGNWTVPAGVYRIRVTCVGGGGAGATGGASSSTYGGGGGGGGTNISLVLGTVIAVTPGSAIAYSVGGAGTQTTFTGATTGAAGSAGSTGSAGKGGAGGAGATGGAGSGGGQGNDIAGSCGGTGGGAGGIGGVGTTVAGSAGNYGGGGGGGSASNGGNAGGAGGAGGSGIIIIEY